MLQKDEHIYIGSMYVHFTFPNVDIGRMNHIYIYKIYIYIYYMVIHFWKWCEMIRLFIVGVTYDGSISIALAIQYYEPMFLSCWLWPSISELTSANCRDTQDLPCHWRLFRCVQHIFWHTHIKHYHTILGIPWFYLILPLYPNFIPIKKNGRYLWPWPPSLLCSVRSIPIWWSASTSAAIRTGPRWRPTCCRRSRSRTYELTSSWRDGDFIVRFHGAHHGLNSCKPSSFILLSIP